MSKLRFKGNNAAYIGSLMEISNTKVVLKFPSGIPALFDPSTVEVLDESGSVVETKKGFKTIYQINGTSVILSNDGSVAVENPKTGKTDEEILADAKNEKLVEISTACEQVIHYGIDINDQHFSLTDKDQTNLFGKQAQLSTGATQIEYHADGEPCRYFTAEEMTAIITAAMVYVTYHTTYCNALNMWIRKTESLDEVKSIYYGCSVPEAYQSEVLVNILASMAAEADETA